MPTEENVEGQTRLHSYKNRGKSCDVSIGIAGAWPEPALKIRSISDQYFPNLRSCARTSNVITSHFWRNEVSVELRKARKDDQLLKRRNIDIDEITTSPLQENQSNNTPTVMSMEMIMDGKIPNNPFRVYNLN
ncbi:hypothetical protein J6590_056317 [Homalodisca vitripennis]|nr:hypothetical protein J6590_056317 [Homalodisca vitripennis]